MSQEPYPSCEWIEGGLAFNRASLHTCLIVHHRTGLPFVADYRGGALPFETLLGVREEIRAANKQEGHPECRGCPHLKTKPWPRTRHPIEIVGIAHYAYCNIKCSYCFLQTQDPASFAAGLKPYSLLPAIRELIEGGYLAAHAIIDWGGGEPTSYPEFDELLSMLLDHGTFHYLHTNGTRFPVSVRRSPARSRHLLGRCWSARDLRAAQTEGLSRTCLVRPGALHPRRLAGQFEVHRQGRELRGCRPRDVH